MATYGNTGRRAGSMALSAAAIAALIACRTPVPRTTAPGRAPPPAAPGDVSQSDASYDWHGLLAAPFGAVLKAVPMTLHEVLLFRDDARGNPESAAAAAAAPECYAADAPAPQFIGRAADEYLLCFTHDRLSSIQASVRVAAAQASAVFAAACARWLKNAAAAVPPSSAPAVAAPAFATCDGNDGAVHFSGRLEAEPESVLFITLDGSPVP